MLFDEKNLRKIICVFLYITVFSMLTFIFFKYLFSPLLPFLLAFFITFLTRRFVLTLNNKLKFKRSFSVFLISLIILGFITFILYLIFSSIFNEITRMSTSFDMSIIQDFSDKLIFSAEKISERYFPAVTDVLTPYFTDFSTGAKTQLMSFLQNNLPVIAKKGIEIFSAFPKIFLFFAVTVLSMFYFGTGYEKIVNFIKLQLTEKQLNYVKEIKNQAFSAIFGTLRAYLILLLLTFVQLWVGFLILDIPYATVLAFIISLVDMLPVLGTGTILIPSAIVSFIFGNLKIAISLVCIYVIITIVRQIAEPRILGNSVGAPPIVTLISMYFGLNLFGISGLFILPLIVIIIKNLNEKNVIKLYKNP